MGAASERQSLETYEQIVALGNDMRELEENPIFKRVFGEHFIEAFAITNVMQIAQYDAATRVRSHEKMIARSHFMQFIEQIKSDAVIAQQNINEILLDAENDDEDDEEE